MKNNAVNLKQICELERKLLDPSIRRSKLELNKLIADDFIEIGASGQLYDKMSAIRTILSNLGQTPKEEYYLRSRLLAPDLVLISYTTHDGKSHRSSMWHYTYKSWKILFHQATTF